MGGRDERHQAAAAHANFVAMAAPRVFLAQRV